MKNILLYTLLIWALPSGLYAQYLDDNFDNLDNWVINNENELVPGTPAKTIPLDSIYWFPGAMLFDYALDMYGDTSTSFNNFADFVRPNPLYPGTDAQGNAYPEFTTLFSVYDFVLNDNSIVEVVKNGYTDKGVGIFLSFPDSLTSYTDSIEGLIDFNSSYEECDGILDDKKIVTQIVSTFVNDTTYNFITQKNFGKSLYFDGARSIKELWSSGTSPANQIDYEFGPSVQYDKKLPDNFYTVTLKNAINVDNTNQTLSFDSYGFANLDSSYVEISKDNGATWTALWKNPRSRNNSYVAVDRVIIPLSTFINIGENYLIRFKYFNDYSFNVQSAGVWFVDNVKIFSDIDGDGYGGTEDCDETNVNINAGVAEILYDGIDNDCNPLTLDYQDADNDGFYSNVDCDDNNSNVNSGTAEIPYDGLDNDCDPLTLDDDLDQDGYINQYDCDDNNPNVNPDASEIIYDGLDNDCNPFTLDDDLDEDGYTSDVDCNDNNPDINPGMTEILYDGLNNDCNNATPDGADGDLDGYNSDVDCNDADPNINPGVTEILYDGIDNDCNPLTRDDDFDEDGYNNADDCDDENSFINPGMAEIPYDGKDNDCNPLTLDDDLDGDGFNGDVDCDDNNPNINPGMTEILNDGLDNDCDPNTSDKDLDNDGYGANEDCNDYNFSQNPGHPEIPYDGLDNDCDPSTPDDDIDQDGYIASLDCDDNNAAINPSVFETPYDGIDNDCNPSTLDDDLDMDGFGIADDCDDQNKFISPNVAEIPYDEMDNDCNPATLDDDLDQDGYVLFDDCDDDNANINPGMTEIKEDGLDNDCDPSTSDLVSTGIIVNGESIQFISYPNPVQNQLNIQLNQHTNFELRLYDINGQLLFFHLYQNTNETSIDFSSYSKGMYLLSISIEGNIGQQIIIK